MTSRPTPWRPSADELSAPLVPGSETTGPERPWPVQRLAGVREDFSAPLFPIPKPEAPRTESGVGREESLALQGTMDLEGPVLEIEAAPATPRTPFVEAIEAEAIVVPERAELIEPVPRRRRVWSNLAMVGICGGLFGGAAWSLRDRLAPQPNPGPVEAVSAEAQPSPLVEEPEPLRDEIAPELRLLGTLPEVTAERVVELRLQVDDPTAQVTFDGAVLQPGTPDWLYPVAIPLPANGSRTVVLEARDAAGNRDRRVIELQHDGLPPRLLDARDQASEDASEVLLDWTFDEALRSLEVEGVALASVPDEPLRFVGRLPYASLSANPNEAGEIRVRWTAVDRAGNRLMAEQVVPGAPGPSAKVEPELVASAEPVEADSIEAAPNEAAFEPTEPVTPVPAAAAPTTWIERQAIQPASDPWGDFDPDRRDDFQRIGSDWVVDRSFEPARRYPERILHRETGLLLRYVPGGRFGLGDDESAEDEGPEVPVRLTGFYLGETECSASAWLRGGGAPRDGAPSGDHPVVNVDWREAHDWCRGQGLELPTEAQWEWAAVGPEERSFPWGSDWDPIAANGAGDRDGWSGTAPVGSVVGDVSWCGVRDLAGNVSEWCADLYQPGYAWVRADQLDPLQDQPGERSDAYVERGGAFSDEEPTSSTYRFGYSPTGLDSLGFRVLLRP